MRNRSPASVTPPASTLSGHWQAEAVRLRETHWGPLEDTAACQAALRQPADLDSRILARAAWLTSHSGLDHRIVQWASSARWALLVLWLGAGLAGIGTAATALGHSQGTVNLALALLGLLGLHALTFLIWLAGYLPGFQSSTTLSRLWLWLTRRFARSQDATLAAQAFLSLLNRARVLKTAVGLISHGAWTAAFLGAIPTLLLLLSARRYTFHWETTLLSPDAFVTFTQAIGRLPQALGFPMPDSFEIAASVGLQPASASIQSGWSLWLLGCVVAWGLLPRLIALIACALVLRHRLAHLRIDPDLPGWLELRDRLLPTHQTLGIDRPAPHALRHSTPAPLAVRGQGASAILGYELGTDLSWPPDGLPAGIEDLGRGDSRTDRVRIRHQLLAPPSHLLLVCDARLTPDRGAMAWLDELRHACPDFHVLCLAPAEQPPSRLLIWQDALARQGIPQMQSLPAWLHHIGYARHG